MQKFQTMAPATKQRQKEGHAQLQTALKLA